MWLEWSSILLANKKWISELWSTVKMSTVKMSTVKCRQDEKVKMSKVKMSTVKMSTVKMSTKNVENRVGIHEKCRVQKRKRFRICWASRVSFTTRQIILIYISMNIYATIFNHTPNIFYWAFCFCICICIDSLSKEVVPYSK